MIDGLLLTKNKIISTPLGDIFHIIKASSEGFAGFGEVYISEVKKNKIKGWKRHKMIFINLTIIQGSVKIVIYDDRENSKTNGEINSFLLGPNINYSRISIPPGLWVAFKGLDQKNLVLNVIPEEHNYKESDNKPLSFLKFT